MVIFQFINACMAPIYSFNRQRSTFKHVLEGCNINLWPKAAKANNNYPTPKYSHGQMYYTSPVILRKSWSNFPVVQEKTPKNILQHSRGENVVLPQQYHGKERIALVRCAFGTLQRWHDVRNLYFNFFRHATPLSQRSSVASSYYNTLAVRVHPPFPASGVLHEKMWLSPQFFF